MLKSHVSSTNFQDSVLIWYGKHARTLPWRVKGGGKADPYKVWLSEIMLQQTTVATVIPYFLKFTEKWPTVVDLANAKDEEVMAEWAGLGYYARARNLLKCARYVERENNGAFPTCYDDLLNISGIGPYTAAAIATIAYGDSHVVVDGNIERIASRVFAIKTPLPKGKKEIIQKASHLFDGMEKREKSEIRSYPQALMDIGATVCTPKSPSCTICPVSEFCKAYKNGNPEVYPVRAIKKKNQQRIGDVFWIQDKKGNLLVEKRAENRMLGGMIGLPTTDWDKKSSNCVFDIKKCKEIGFVTHVFSHFSLKLNVYVMVVSDIQNMIQSTSDTMVVVPIKDIKKIGFPTVFLKVARFAHAWCIEKRLDEI